MHKEILSVEQINLLTFLKSIGVNFGLVGGTAIALYLGHRQSIDFDLFSTREFDNFDIQNRINKENLKIERVFIDRKGEYTILVNGVKITFFHYPFMINFSEQIDGSCRVADLLTLSSLKAYALGRRAKWKDYVDLYFVMKEKHDIKEIINKSNEIFGNNFNEKLFRSQLAYFKDIDFTEKIIFMNGNDVDDAIIKKELINFSLMI